MPTRWLKQIIPRDLTIKVGVNINEPWGHDETSCINDFARLCHDASRDLGDSSVLDGKVGHELLGASAIDNGAVTNNQIEHNFPLRSTPKGPGQNLTHPTNFVLSPQSIVPA